MANLQVEMAVGYPAEIPQDIPRHADTQILQPSAGQKPWSSKLKSVPQSQETFGKKGDVQNIKFQQISPYMEFLQENHNAKSLVSAIVAHDYSMNLSCWAPLKRCPMWSCGW